MEGKREKQNRVAVLSYLDDLLVMGVWEELAAFTDNRHNDKGLRIYARDNLRLAERRIRNCGEYDRYSCYLKQA